MNKKVTSVMRAVKKATSKMERNHEVLKKAIREGIKPSSLKGKMQVLCPEFEKDLDIEQKSEDSLASKRITNSDQ